jgi:hypothetical protein
VKNHGQAYLYLFAIRLRTVKAFLKEGFMTDVSSSAWRTAYISALFQTDAATMTLKIANALAAILERLNSPIEISGLEHEAIETARIKLATLKVASVEVVKTAPLTADTPS